MTDLESRLKSQLSTQSESLPASPFGADSAMTRARRRQRRSYLVSSVGAVVLVAGLALGAGPIWESFFDSVPDRSETVVADQPQATSRPDRGDSSILEVETTTTTDRGNTTNRSSPAAHSENTSDENADETDAADDNTANGAAADENITEKTTVSGVVSAPMDQAIGRLAPGSVLFHSDNEDCVNVPDGRGHPDWIEGQPGTASNDDGTPTYGFAYNTGDSTNGEIDWRFLKQPGAPSGSCVLSLTLNRADNSSHAVRLFRRYDQDGNQLPDDAYYSVWLYFPEVIEFDRQGTIDGQDVFGFWNVFQIKNDQALGDGRRSLSALSFNVGKLPDEVVMSMSAYSKVPCGSAEDCDRAFTIDQAEPVPIPTERWVHFELHLQSRADETGQLKVWQDGRQILTFEGRTERPDTVRRTWSLTSMGHLHNLRSHTLFADDPLISTEPIHPELFGP